MRLLVPFKGVREAKSRLRVDGVSRHEIVLRLLHSNLKTAARVFGAKHVYLVTPENEPFGEFQKLQVQGRGLNLDLEEARTMLGSTCDEPIGVLLPDLPNLCESDLESLHRHSQSAQVVLCPDHLGVGTNALALNPGHCLPYLFEGASFARHQDKAAALGLSVFVLQRDGLANDCDDPESLRKFSVL